MKIIQFIFSLVFFTASHLFAQSDGKMVSGSIKEVIPHFAGEHTLIVGETELVLLSDPTDKSGKKLQINEAYKDLLMEKKGKYSLNPKYKGKQFKFTYEVNGKGWKCIQHISAIKE